jgi:DNA polymerase
MGDGFVCSRRVKERDWAALLGAPEAVECDCRPKGLSSVGLRFRMGKLRTDGVKFNGEIPRSCPPSSPSAPAADAGAAARPSPDNAPTAAAVTLPDLGGEAAPVYLDLETRSAADLKRDGGRVYARDPATEILCATALLDGRLVVWTPTLAEPLPTAELWPDGFGTPLPIDVFASPALPAPLADAVAAGRALCAHNAGGFERHLWAARGLPAPAAWLDSIHDARAAGLPGKLEELGQILLCRGKDPGAQQMLRLCRPDRRGLFPPLTNDAAVKLARYNVADVLLLAGVHGATRGSAEPAVVAAHRAVNDRGVAFDADLAHALIALDSQVAAEAADRAEQATAGEIGAADLTNVQKLRAWLAGRGVALPDLQRATVEARLAVTRHANPVAAAVLEARLAAGRTTAAKLEGALAALGDDGRLRDLLVYHGAHTGRWAGRGVQPHNLPRPYRDLKDVRALLGAAADPAAFRAALPASVGVADGLAALVRPCVRAGPGMLLCVLDYAAIEARGLAWCAGDEPALARFAAGENVYLKLASRLFGRPLSAADKEERAVGKEAELGCGYGMGQQTFAARCAARGLDLAAAGLTAEEVVEGYRDAHPAVAGTVVPRNGRRWREGGLWRDVERAAREALQGKGERRAGRCAFHREGGVLVVGLPSGRRLCYRNARLEDRLPSYPGRNGGPPRPKPTIVFDAPDSPGEATYGGKLVENVVQAVCRDLLAALLACEGAGLPVVLHVHDELVIEVEEGRAEASLRRAAELMSAPPTWAAGIPLQVEGFAAERYYKAAPPGSPTVLARDGRVVGQ